MQTPTPPTKPTPPTPPSMKTPSKTTSTDTPAPSKNTPKTSTPSNETVKTSSTEKPQTTPEPEAKNNVPPLGSYSNSNNSATSTSEKTPPAIPANPKNNPFSIGTTVFLAIAVFITVGTAAVLWFKNNKPKQKQQPMVNYSNENTDDIVNLILSPLPPTPAPPATKSPPKKMLLKPATKPKDKGGFEVRV